ncbi:MAG TPA: endonuclease domain-containing protein [Rhizobiaceae bacterium]|nr:endonuclease domain-containing protein [Rhizobiaceae bacterium]
MSEVVVTKRRPGATARARGLRGDETEAEYRLWGELRNRRLNGFKFARQIPIGPYFADFVCRETLLVLELDGGQHSESAHDEIRTRFLNAHGYSVLRFWNDEVLRERRAVLDTIPAALEGRLAPAPSPDLRFAPATLSPRGEGVETRHSRDQRGGCRSELPPLPSGERVAGAKRRSGEGGGAVVANPAEGAK